MQRKKRFILNAILLINILLIYKLAKSILNRFNLEFRNKVYYTYIALIMILSFLLVVQIIYFIYRTMKNKKLRFSIRLISGIGVGILSLLLIFSVLLSSLHLLSSHKNEHIVEKDGNKMVAYVQSFMQINVYYYDYKNSFIRGRQMKILVDGGNGGYDPYKNGSEPYVYRYIYWDDMGNVLKSTWSGE